jgi:hypothetical protein
MGASNIPRVIEYLKARPDGAYGWQIAEFLESNVDSAGQTLARMLMRGSVIQHTPNETRGNSLWKLPAEAFVETPPIFRAMEILSAMRATARANQRQFEFVE